MASPTKGDGRSKPEWGKAPAPAPAARKQPARQPAPAKRTAVKKKAQPTARRAAPGTGRPAATTRARSAKATPPKRRPAARPQRRKPRGQFHKRYGVVYDIDGPRVRLGICWFAIAFVAIVLGPLTTAIVYGTTAALAAAQTARSWRKGAPKPNDLMAAGGAGLMAAGACFGAGGAGLGLLGCVALCFVGAAGDGSSRNPRIADIGWTLQCAAVPGAVAVSMVLLARLDQGSAIGLLLLVSAYETGDYIIGSGSHNAFEGPGAGAAGIVVITFILSTLPISALSFGQAWAFGGMVAVLAPAGQLYASALLPSAGTPASGLRRLDSLLLVAPAWAWGVGLVI